MFDKENLKFIIKYLILFFIFAFITLFLCSSAMALQVVNPNVSLVKNNITYYGYDLPTRPTKFDGSSSASVNVNYSYWYNAHWNNVLTDTQLLYLKDLPETYINLIGDDVDSIPSVWTSSFSLHNAWQLDLDTSHYQYYFSLGFRPAGVANNNVDMFDDGFAINYDGIYSYTFDLIMYNPDGFDNGVPIQNVLSFSMCDIAIGDTMSCVANNNISYQRLHSDNNLDYYRVNVLFNSNSWNNGFNDSTISDNNSIYGVKGNNIIAITEQVKNYGNIYTVSQPYNIRFWSEISSFSCTNSCWTQADTDSNQRIEYPNDYIFSNLISVVDNFDYFGFGGIVHYTYDFIKGLLEDSNTSCIELEVPVLSKILKLPSSCTFWGRNDISSFKQFYEMFFTGLFAFFIGFRIYNDILNLYNPDSKIDSEVSKL